jgi:dienelactone hydrolase
LAIVLAALAGTVTQGRLRGGFRLRPGSAPTLSALGLYRAEGGAAIALVVPGSGLPTWLVELPSGNIHGVGPGLTTVGARAGDASGDGTLTVRTGTIRWAHGGASTIYRRVPLRQREVRLGPIAATLTLPPGTGPFPAVAMVHGAGPLAREEFQVFAAYCELRGIAVLAGDKRGVGESRGRYPGEQATLRTIDVLAADAQVQARWLAAAPEIDAKRIGLLGDSQAGWIIALAAARERAVRWGVGLAGPTVTVGTADTWASLAGQGQSPPSGTTAKMLDQARVASSGFDPGPFLRKVRVPIHWVFAEDDRTVPTRLCIESLEHLRPGHDFSWTVVDATHTLLELPSGLNVDLPRSRGFGRGLFPSVGSFLRRIGVAA